MGSLILKLFDTMPLSGVRDAMNNTAGSIRQGTVGQLAEHLTFFKNLQELSITASRPQKDDIDHKRWSRIPIWGYTMPTDPRQVTGVTCRVRDDDFNNYVVLEKLEWGYAPLTRVTSFKDAIHVVFEGASIELPLSESFRLLSFVTNDGQNDSGHPLWPAVALHDPSLVHVFAYDLHRGTNKLKALKADDHPQKTKVDELLSRLGTLQPGDTRNAHDFLFADDLWDTSLSKAPPTGTVPENVDLSLHPVRILVACCLTVCKERDDFQPGRPMGAGRIYPHVMVVATAPLDSIDAGVRMTRPKTMTLTDGRCTNEEMLHEIGGLLVADSNKDSAVVDIPFAPAPLPFLSNLFNYFIPDPYQDPSLRNKPIPIVRRAIGEMKDPRKKSGLVDRYCEDLRLPPFDTNAIFNGTYANRSTVAKFPRQGMFDNLHLAPRMKVVNEFDTVMLDGPIGGGSLNNVRETAPADLADWKMDKVVMAPFCAHDCFHMHWRWSDNQNDVTETWGFGGNRPCMEKGRPMVPENQDVYLVLLSDCAVSYLATADHPPVDAWQVFCHHGAGYGLSIGNVVFLAKKLAPLMDRVSFEKGLPPFNSIDAGKGWALFYWRLRYRFKVVERPSTIGTSQGLEVEERFDFVDRAKALGL